MHLKLGIVLERKPNIKDLDNIVADVLYPYLSSTPSKEIILRESTKSNMKEKYKTYKEESYRGVSYKKRKEDMISKGIDTFEGFCKNHYGIIKFNQDNQAIITFNDKAFIDEYKISDLKRVNELEQDYLSLYLKALIDKNLVVHHRELQVYKLAPSTVIKPIVDTLKKTDYIIIVNYSF